MSFILRSIKETIKEDREYGRGGNRTEAEGGMKNEDKERKRILLWRARGSSHMLGTLTLRFDNGEMSL